jgi:WhiB family redox-sensing transcriptional regulator
MTAIPEAPPTGGACKGHDVEMWFPLRDMKRTRDVHRKIEENIRKAKEICSGCSVKDQCLEYSLHWEPYGIWGGLDESQRHEVRIKRNIFPQRQGMINMPGRGTKRVQNVSTYK